MNIFFLDLDPKTCAQYHCDKHVVKMIVEYGQLLSTAHRVLDGKQFIEKRISKIPVPATWDEMTSIADSPIKMREIKRFSHPNSRLDSLLYKATHINHPCAKWVRDNPTNYKWLWDLLYYTCLEYSIRYKKIHSIERLNLLRALSQVPSNILNMKTDFPFAMPEKYINKDNVVQSYRDFYNAEKRNFATWKFTQTPYWYEGN